MVEFLGLQFIVTNPPLNPVSAQELSAVEDELGFLFPDDYRAFITTFGAGEINICIRAISPQNILKSWLHDTRDRLAELYTQECVDDDGNPIQPPFEFSSYK